MLYNLTARGIEYDLLGWSADHAIPVMAYSPLGNDNRMLRHPELQRIAHARGATAAQVALAFVLARPNVIAIPKATGLDHVAENRAAADLTLTAADLAALDTAFPPPRRKQSLARAAFARHFLPPVPSRFARTPGIPGLHAGTPPAWCLAYARRHP